MWYFFFAFVGMIAGGICVFIAQLNKHNRLREQERRVESMSATLNRTTQALDAQQKSVDDGARRLKASQTEFERKAVSYKELQDENALIKRDLHNLAVAMRKLELDRDLQRQTQDAIDQRATELGGRYLKENVKWLSASINQNNYASCKQRLLDVIERCRGIGLGISDTEQFALLASLKEEFEKAVKAALEREEQARIKAQIREEQLREREIQRELKQLEREREAIKAALESALKAAHGQFNEEVARLQQRLAEAEARSQRAISQAQLTKAGFLYVISNIGSFGDSVFKVGMTRRLEPYDRVRELGDASVPFPFDVHMMISCNDAPALENALHRTLHKMRLNKVNPRKEFFKVDLDLIAKIVKEHHGDIEYRADPEALEYRQSLSMSEEDMEYIEHVFDEAEEEERATLDSI